MLSSAELPVFHQYLGDINTPPICTIYTNKGKKVETLVDNKALRDQLKNYQLGERELFTLTTSEGVTLNGWMVKPADFNASNILW